MPRSDSRHRQEGGPLRPSDAPVTYVLVTVLLLAAFVGLLWVPSYAHLMPTLGGFPFFYWYSLLWLVVNAACQIISYQLLVAGPRRRQPAQPGQPAERRPATQP